jgi:hypothetical protein
MAAALIAAASLAASSAYAVDKAAPAKKQTTTKKAKAPAAPTVEDQIKALREEMQAQINGLKNTLADKDTQLKQAQQAAADAQAAAAKAQEAATAQQQAVTENSSAVTTLQSTVSDMRNANASAVSSITDEAAAIRKTISEPDAFHFKGVTISPTGSFIASETTWRSAALASDENTPFTKIPLQHAANAQISEFNGSARQSRIALKAIGKIPNATLTGYYEVDWLGAGVTSNGNQSNSYLLRQRQIWMDAKFNNGWDFSAGQGFSLSAETTSGLSRGTEILPGTIDAAYTPGFVWTRQWSARVAKNIGKKVVAGFSLENPEGLDPSGQNTPSNLMYSGAGTTGGLYNNGNNYTYNLTPDFIAKIAVEPGWGHFELFGIGRTFRDRIYACATVSATCSVATTATPTNSSAVWGAGVGGGFRGPLFQKKVTVGLKGLWGQGVGRYGDSTIADVTIRPNETLSPLHGFSGLASVDFNPNPRLNIYLNYGGDYIGRDIFYSTFNGTTTQVGYGTYTANMSGCLTEVAGSATGASLPISPANCGGSTKDVQAFVAGYWYNFYSGPKGRFRQGIQYSYDRRDIWSGAGGTTNPGGGAYGYDNMIFTSFRYYLP